jgi:molecular chaperone DnaK
LNVVGIDLGTTCCSVSYLDRFGRLVSVPNSSGQFLTPSRVAFQQGDVEVGGTDGAECEGAYFKRELGKDELYFINGVSIRPVVLSAILLRALKEDIQSHLGYLPESVITVPAFFDEKKRLLTKQAAEMAGLKVRAIVNEPTAAAIGILSELLNQTANKKMNVLVYDLGGGTFDVSIIQCSEFGARVLATDGDLNLGGKDFDECLKHLIETKFKQAGLTKPILTSAQLENWKIQLTSVERIEICGISSASASIYITREEFEAAASSLIGQTRILVALVMSQGNLSWSDIDGVLMVGGASKMPMVSRMISKVSNGTQLLYPRSAQHAVSHGAAKYGEIISSPRNSFKVIDVTAHSLGIIATDRKNKRAYVRKLIPKNTPLPTVVKQRCVTAYPDQSNVILQLVEGESEDPAECITLGKCKILLPPSVPANTGIDTIIAYNKNGVLDFKASIPMFDKETKLSLSRVSSYQSTDNLDELVAKYLQTFNLRQ